MAKPTKFTALLPDGTIAKRSSVSKTYLFAIATGPIPKASRIADNEAGIAQANGHVAGYRLVLDYLQADGELVLGTPGALFTQIHAPGLGKAGDRLSFLYLGETTIDEARARMIADYTSHIENTTAQIAKLAASTKELQAGPELVGGWIVQSWSSRRDLAEKAAGSVRGWSKSAEVRILPAITN